MIPAFIALGLASILHCAWKFYLGLRTIFTESMAQIFLFRSSLLFFIFVSYSLILSMKCCVFVKLENSTNVCIAIALRWL